MRAFKHCQTVLAFVEEEIDNGKIGDVAGGYVLLSILPTLPVLESHVDPPLAEQVRVKVISRSIIPGQIHTGAQSLADVNKSLRGRSGNAERRTTKKTGSNPQD